MLTKPRSSSRSARLKNISGKLADKPVVKDRAVYRFKANYIKMQIPSHLKHPKCEDHSLSFKKVDNAPIVTENGVVRLVLDGVKGVFVPQGLYDILVVTFVKYNAKKHEDVSMSILDEARKKLKEARINAKLSQAKLAELLGVKRQFISAVERGEARFGKLFYNKALEACGAK